MDESTPITIQTEVIPVPVEVASPSPSEIDGLRSIIFEMRDKWERQVTELKERLDNLPPQTVVQVETTVEAPPQSEPTAEPEAEPVATVEAETVEAVTVVEAEESGDATETTVIASDASSVEVEAPEVVSVRRERGPLANLLLGKRRS